MGLDSEMRSLKRHSLQILSWGRRIVSVCKTRSASYMMIDSQAIPRNCCKGGARLIKQLVWRIRSKLKQYYLRRMKGNTAVQYSYDPQSYCQNFDSGRRSLDPPSPFAP